MLMPQMIDILNRNHAAAMAAQRGGILQTNGKASVIARDLLPGYVKIHATQKAA